MTRSEWNDAVAAIEGGNGTRETVAACVAHIAEPHVTSDDEWAHRLEDDLHLAVMRAIANGATNARELADAACETSKLRFSRWYS